MKGLGIPSTPRGEGRGESTGGGYLDIAVGGHPVEAFNGRGKGLDAL